MDKVVPADDDAGDDGVETLSGAVEEKVSSPGNIPYVKADLGNFAKNFVGAYETGAVYDIPKLLMPLQLDMGCKSSKGEYGVRRSRQYSHS